MITKLNLNPEKIIKTNNGDILHIIKKDSLGYKGFGEAYFSKISSGKIKAWKRHKEMTLNIVVPVGKIQFATVQSDEFGNSEFKSIILSEENYFRLTIPPMTWFGFKGLGREDSMLINIADIPHDPAEAESKKHDEIKFKWEVN